ncbi:hypothetical protein JW905_17710 [bacterium]|nr:hypothetical protein [candidate division CSSED10-310 bacterium]
MRGLVMCVALLTFVSPAVFIGHAAGQLHCGFCGKEITGAYFRYEGGLVVCSACKERLPECARCGLPTREWRTVGGAVLCPACAAATAVCDRCGRALLGKYVEFERGERTLRLCDECRRKAVTCAACGLPIIGKATLLRGQHYCTDCLEHRQRCALCDRPVGERFWRYQTTAGESVFCDDCYRDRPHCSVCGLPFNGGYEVDGKPVCGECFDNLPRCGACGRVMTDHSWKYPGSEKKFCDRCRVERKRCDVCGVPLGNRFRVLSDGRRLCDACSRHGVVRREDALRLYRKTARLMAAMGMKLDILPELVLTDGDRLERLARDIPGGDPDKATGLFRQQGDDRTVYVITALPPRVLVAVAAHELAHAWHTAHSSREQSRLLKEGFAEWVSYQVLARLKMTDQMAVIEARQDMYGMGFRKIRAIEKKRGFSGVLEYVTGR